MFFFVVVVYLPKDRRLNVCIIFQCISMGAMNVNYDGTVQFTEEKKWLNIRILLVRLGLRVIYCDHMVLTILFVIMLS